MFARVVTARPPVIKKVSLVKGDSDLKVRLENCEDLARTCESLNFYFPAQAEPFY